jgi:hypothetical protein
MYRFPAVYLMNPYFLIYFLIFVNVLRSKNIQIVLDDHQMDPKNQTKISSSYFHWSTYHHWCTIFTRIFCTNLDIIFIKLKKLFAYHFTKNNRTKWLSQKKKLNDLFTVIVLDMNSDFQAFHIQQHVVFHAWLSHYRFLHHLIYVPEFKQKGKDYKLKDILGCYLFITGFIMIRIFWH